MMDLLTEVYSKSADTNEKSLHFWEKYLESLKSLDLSIYSDKLKVPTLVPIGSRISFRGELKHTNEVTVSLGADYFVKCSIKQAEVLRQHRIKDAESKVDVLKKEKKYLENQMSFTQKALYENQGKEIIEDYNEEDEKVWREAHRKKVRNYKQNKGKKDKAQTESVTDEELWNRLEELELQEELENELFNEQDDNIDNEHLPNRDLNFAREYLSSVQQSDYQYETLRNQNFAGEELSNGQHDNINDKHELNRIPTSPREIDELKYYIETENEKERKLLQEKSDSEKEKKVTFYESKTSEKTSKSDKLQQVIDKQNELEELLIKVKNRARAQTKNKSDLEARLDELEQLDELEDEMDRLEDIIENEAVEEDDEDTNETKAPKLQRRVSFVDEDDSNTLEITFKHSPVDSKNEPYNSTEGIQKPSDIYDAHSKLFGNGTTSILKKSKYEAVADKSDTKTLEEKVVQFDIQVKEKPEPENIVIKDVVEKVTQEEPKIISQARPSSLFKKKRMQNKS